MRKFKITFYNPNYQNDINPFNAYIEGKSKNNARKIFKDKILKTLCLPEKPKIISIEEEGNF